MQMVKNLTCLSGRRANYVTRVYYTDARNHLNNILSFNRFLYDKVYRQNSSVLDMSIVYR